MFSKLLIPLLLLQISTPSSSKDLNFTFNGFKPADLALDGIAEDTATGLLRLTNATKQQKGHAFFPNPVTFKSSPAGAVSSFSTTFVFAIRSEYATLSGHGFAFVISPTRGLPGALPGQYLGLFSVSNNGNATNHVFAVEFDTIKNSEFEDINYNHVGIDLNGLKSEKSAPAWYYNDKNGEFKNMTLISGQPMKVWIDYDGFGKQINVSLSPTNVENKPQKPLLSLTKDLSSVIDETMYVGFSSSTGSVPTSHYILGWSFKLNGQVEDLDISELPKLPRIKPKPKSKLLTIGLPAICLSFSGVGILGVVYFIKRKRKFAELVEDWELEYGPQRYKYKHLYIATKGFKEKEFLGSGGFGRVYKGVLPTTKTEIAVKKVSHESRQGMREFVAEIASMGRLRHRNLVPLLGYCRRKGELLLVYDYMPNGSLDKYLYDQPKTTLNWSQRFRVIKGVAAGLFYLHEEWEQVVVHRDVKASNVLLDGELNGRLGDFGLARLYDHGTDPQTTHVAGTVGYLAPEHTRTGKATTSTDVFAFGAFILEVASGRRPIEGRSSVEDVILVDYVFSCWSRGSITEAKDPNFGTDFVEEEVEVVMKLGLLCSHSEPAVRPSMRQVVQYLEKDVAIPDLSTLGLCAGGLTFAMGEGFTDFAMPYPSSMNTAFLHASSSVAKSLLSSGQ
ncbi:L-type lectin-domain containing receptor kinase IV.1 [Morus notabilis]|uniref:non-specific serine/threonine protein kinase n=1 Tax=Morus notabilis TaxID=981085 RepID=W9RWQ9_9ROSA|nr:L-type lectin-domain containing receptor kinase IV.1 [Morus notabilis]EXC14819.1 L-type lectin-domain containing receptor kinase IV.1 [Morus notabilis]